MSVRMIPLKVNDDPYCPTLAMDDVIQFNKHCPLFDLSEHPNKSIFRGVNFGDLLDASRARVTAIHLRLRYADLMEDVRVVLPETEQTEIKEYENKPGYGELNTLFCVKLNAQTTTYDHIPSKILQGLGKQCDLIVNFGASFYILPQTGYVSASTSSIQGIAITNPNMSVRDMKFREWFNSLTIEVNGFELEAHFTK